MNNNAADNSSAAAEDPRRHAEIMSRLADAATEAEDKDVGIDADEAAAINRILDNLGLRESTVNEKLQDQSISDVVSEWSNTSAALSVHRGDSQGNMPIAPTAALDDLFDTKVGQLAATIGVTSPEAGTSRITATVGVPYAPAKPVIAEIVISGWSTPLRFPLQLVNRGSETFALYELSGSASVLERDLNDSALITEVRLQTRTNLAPEDQQ